MKSLLKESIRLYGLIDGLKFWFEWNIKWPIQKFVWLNITHRPYCTYHGFYCKSLSGGKCNYPKLTKKEEILKRWKKIEEESKKIIQGPNGECAYCGVFPGRKLIPDPNGGPAKWNICLTCEKIINAQMRLSIAILMLEKADENNREYWENEIRKAQEEIELLSEESFLPTCTIIIKKKE